MASDRKFSLIADIHHAFTPGAPIASHDLFAGRSREIQKAIATVFQPGQHAIIYGERGVGKTSLANTLFDLLVVMGKFNYQRAKLNCSEGMSFEQIWKSIFKQLKAKIDGNEINVLLPPNPHCEDIREGFDVLDGPSIIILDELDRITDAAVQRALADTIKTLSDNSVDTTLIMVGVADSVDQLITEHRSIERAFRQIRLRPMSKPEVLELLGKGLARCPGLDILPSAKDRIADYSQGLPFYAHLLAREAALHAVESDRTYLVMADLDYAVKEAVDSQLESRLEDYRIAVKAPRGINFKPVLLACALAKKDEQGFFYASNVVEPLNLITQKDYRIPAFARHLQQFSTQARGRILMKKGRLYRFLKPIMVPYVILRGLADGLITESQLSHPETTSIESAQLSLLSSSSLQGIEI
jgi:hypothetical protein